LRSCFFFFAPRLSSVRSRVIVRHVPVKPLRVLDIGWDICRSARRSGRAETQTIWAARSGRRRSVDRCGLKQISSTGWGNQIYSELRPGHLTSAIRRLSRENQFTWQSPPRKFTRFIPVSWPRSGFSEVSAAGSRISRHAGFFVFHAHPSKCSSAFERCNTSRPVRTLFSVSNRASMVAFLRCLEYFGSRISSFLDIFA